jgi:hypothetical protein
MALPLIPFVRLRRIVGETRESGSWDKVPVLAMLVLGLFVSALGEFIWYAAGPGQGPA